MKASVYVETTIPNYLTAWRSPELVMVANHEATRGWREIARPRYGLFISGIVVPESGVGDLDAAKRRLAVIEDIPELDISGAVEQLADGEPPPPRSHDGQVVGVPMPCFDKPGRCATAICCLGP